MPAHRAWPCGVEQSLVLGVPLAGAKDGGLCWAIVAVFTIGERVFLGKLAPFTPRSGALLRHNTHLVKAHPIREGLPSEGCTVSGRAARSQTAFHSVSLSLLAAHAFASDELGNLL